MSYFVRPARGVLESDTEQYIGQYRTYAHYNYLRAGPISALKRCRLEVALRMARPWFHLTGALDFGCADGVLLPSLARHFPFAIGIDHNERVILTAEQVLRELGIDTVDVLCSNGLSWAALRERVGNGYGMTFLLETIEHVGRPSDVASEVDDYRVWFIRQVFNLMEPGGHVVVSVPRMTGVGFLAKYAGQRALGLAHEPIPVGDALRAGILGDTTPLEPRYNGGHVGFNDRKFDRAVRGAFRVVDSRQLPFTRLYLVALPTTESTVRRTVSAE